MVVKWLKRWLGTGQYVTITFHWEAAHLTYNNPQQFRNSQSNHMTTQASNITIHVGYKVKWRHPCGPLWADKDVQKVLSEVLKWESIISHISINCADIWNKCGLHISYKAHQNQSTCLQQCGFARMLRLLIPLYNRNKSNMFANHEIQIKWTYFYF